MLYDNAQLARVYVHAWALTGEPATSRRRPGRSTTCCASCGRPRAASRPARTRTPTGEEGGDLRLVRGRDPRGAGRRRRAVRRGLRRDGRRQLGGPHDPVADPRRRASSAERFGLAARDGRRAAGRGAGGCCWNGAPSGPSPPGTTRCWRPGTASRSARSRMRPGARGGGRRRRWTPTRTGTGTPRVAAAGAVARGLLGGGRTPAALVEGRPSDRGRRARGLREPGRGPARPVRGDR